jgi:hypothetical protein
MTKTTETTVQPLWRDRKHFMWFPFSFTVYEVKNDRLYIQRGLLSTSYDETLLYRITDVKLTRSLGQKIFGTGTIELCTTVDHDGHILLENVKNPMDVKAQLSELVEDARDKKKVIGKEFYGGHGGMNELQDLDGDGEPDIL